MSEDRHKNFLINELKRLNYKVEEGKLPLEDRSLDALEAAHEFQLKLNTLREAKHQNPDPKKDNFHPQKPKIKPIDMSRENAMAFSQDVAEFMIKSNAIFDDRIILDERYKTNVHITTADPYATIVLRDEEGRCL